MFHISRRDLVIGAAGAYAAFGLDKHLAFIGAAQAQTIPPGPGFKTYKVGDIEVISLFDGVWEKPHDETFIKGVNVEQTKAALKVGGLTDAFFPIPFTVLAVKTGGRVVLIDSGTGGGQAGGPKAGLLAQSMAAAGIDPKAVNTIVVSHFHPDHIFGLMAKDTNAQTFPDAEIIVPATELKWWTQPLDAIAQPRRGLAQRIQATLPDWQAAFDHVPDQAVETRRKLFDRAIADKAMVAGYHWGLPNVGTIAKDGSGYAFTGA